MGRERVDHREIAPLFDEMGVGEVGFEEAQIGLIETVWWSIWGGFHEDELLFGVKHPPDVVFTLFEHIFRDFEAVVFFVVLESLGCLLGLIGWDFEYF